MIHLRIVATPEKAEKALELLVADGSVCNVVSLRGAAEKPKGDVILCDITPEDASVIIGDLKELGIHKDGSIAIEEIDIQLAVNLVMIVLAGVGTLFIQRRLYQRRRVRHLNDPERQKAGLPIGRSARSDGGAER